MDETELERIRKKKRQELIESERGSETGSKSTPDSPIEIGSEAEFEELTRKYDTVLVDCYADWCGPCQMMEATIDALATETNAAVAKIDVDRHQHLAQRLGAQGVPTFVVFEDGEPTKRLVGAQDRTTLENLLRDGS